MPRQGKRCCCFCKNTDFLLLIDTTGSMGGAIEDMKLFVSYFVQATINSNPTPATRCRFAVADFRDEDNGGEYSVVPPAKNYVVRTPLSTNHSVVSGAIYGLTVDGGGDLPEGWLRSIEAATANWVADFGGDADKTARKRVIILIGDAYAHEGGIYPTLADVGDDVADGCFSVYGFNYDALDGIGQVTYLASRVAGRIFMVSGGQSGARRLARQLCAAIAKRVTCP
jgi:hypothetical protein